MIDFGVSERKASELQERMKKCGVSEADLEEHFVRSQGAGGQKVNKTSTCVHLKHLPSGLSVKMQKSRSQKLNRYYARKRLCELLENSLLGNESPEAKKLSSIRKQKDRRRRRARRPPPNEEP
ncbi:MAG: peptide chain release factor-like protein [Phycisphaerae bacterium]|nr:peptide chain release factor-like protein [Phycisphaerae bacterium]